MSQITRQFINRKALDLVECLQDNFLEIRYQKLKQQQVE
jgi:hypothetical protein